MYNSSIVGYVDFCFVSIIVSSTEKVFQGNLGTSVSKRREFNSNGTVRIFHHSFPH